jgi:K+-sensing histidine kinase KdpD
VAQSVQGPGAARQRESQDVLVAVRRPGEAEVLVRRGVRLARQLGSRCFVLAVSPPGSASAALAGEVEAAAAAAGASVISRDGRDISSLVTGAVQEVSAKHLVVAAPSPSRLERWRATPIERLVSALPGVHLHIQPQGALTPKDGQRAQGAAEGAAADPRAQRRGAIRVYLGYAPGCGTTTAMLEEALRRQSRGTDVVVGAVATRDREQLAALIEQLEVIGDGATLDTEAVLARRPEVVCVDELTAGPVPAPGTPETTGEPRFAAARRLAEQGITVVGTVQVTRLPDAGSGVGAPLTEPALLALADEIELIDVPPSILIDRVRRGEIVPADQIPRALETTYAIDTLRADRERAFRLVAAHGERVLAGYAGDDPPRAQLAAHERSPSILACLSPEPGMGRLIRRSAALAAQVDGAFGVAVVQQSQPGPEEDQLLLDYAGLTEQLGGEFTVVAGSTPAAALAEYAIAHQVTELVVSRAPTGTTARYPVLRELSRLASDAELHVLPAENGPG